MSSSAGSYWGIHRADLQAVLSKAVGLERINLSHRLTDLVQHPDRVSLSFANGRHVDADLVIGADGARSITRRWMLGYDDALYSGCSGFRGVVPAGRMDLLPDPEAIQFWVGPQGHLLHYPIGDQGDQNFLLVERHPSPWSSRDWVTPASEGEQLRLFKDWHPAVVQMITAVPISQRWGLFHRPPLGRWSKGRVTLIGDAAHALVPHHGQGANQSIEDAVVLAAQLAQGGAGPLARGAGGLRAAAPGPHAQGAIRLDNDGGRVASARRARGAGAQRPPWRTRQPAASSGLDSRFRRP